MPALHSPRSYHVPAIHLHTFLLLRITRHALTPFDTGKKTLPKWPSSRSETSLDFQDSTTRVPSADENLSRQAHPRFSPRYALRRPNRLTASHRRAACSSEIQANSSREWNVQRLRHLELKTGELKKKVEERRAKLHHNCMLEERVGSTCK